MGVRHQRIEQGFTIIEVVLFVAITGLLAAALLSGWTAMINTQRYKDSTRTLQSFLQQQYNLVYNVENGRIQNLSCVLQGTSLIIDDTPGSNAPRGQSPCVVMGRYVQIQNGTKINIFSIVGYAPVNDTTNTDIDSIRLYNPQRVDFELGLSDNELSIPWQATIVGANDSTPQDYAIVIIRSPKTGIVHTFTKDTTGQSLTLSDIINTQNESSDVNLCLDPGVPFASGRLGITIDAYASAQSSVRQIADGKTTCPGGNGG
jgi:type II secretory pathway pseudopilin PulG